MMSIDLVNPLKGFLLGWNYFSDTIHTVDEYTYEETGEQTTVSILTIYLGFLRFRRSSLKTKTVEAETAKLSVLRGGNDGHN